MVRFIWNRSAVGNYQLNGTSWIVHRDETNPAAYRWIAEHPDKGEFFRSTLAKAKETAETVEIGA
jgi:hypothetical protein